MYNTEHWTICREFSSKCKFEEKINSFMVLRKKGESLLIVTEDGKGYFYNKECDKPILWNTVSNIVDVAQGNLHALILNREGKVYLYGGFFLWTDPLKNPVLIPSPHKFISVKCGSRHCLALTKDGKVYAWGRNESYQVGHCDELDRVRRQQHFISELDQHRIVAIACGEFHSLALTDDGDVYAWGDNSMGQIGNREIAVHVGSKRAHRDSPRCKRCKPVRMNTSCPIKAIAAGQYHTLLLTHDGQVYACGLNRSGPVCRRFGYIFFRECPIFSNFKIVVGLPPICQIGSHFSERISIAISFDRTCFVWNIDFTDVPLRLPRSYSTIDSAMSLLGLSRFSSSQCLPNLARVQENKLDELSNCLARMFDNSESSNVQFVVQDQIIHGHRSILRNASRHLDQMFSTTWCSVEPTARIVIAEHCYLLFHAYLRFLYTDCLPDSFEIVTELLKLANSYQEVALQQKCCARLQRNNPGTTAQIEGPKTDCLLNCMIRMLDNPEASDVQFVVVVEEGRIIIPAHRSILQNSSSYFERMFSKTWCGPQIDPNTNPITKILIPDHSYSVVYSYLYFLYTRRLQVSHNDLTDLFELAIYYVEDRLQQLCLERMWCDLSVENCLHYYQLTECYTSSFPQSFVRNLIQFISVRSRLVYSTDQYKKLDQTQQEKLSVDIENYV